MLTVAAVAAASGEEIPLVGRPLHAVLDEFQRSGMPLVYTTQLVPDRLVVEAAPRAIEPRAVVAELLTPHGLTLRSLDDLLLVVRRESGAPADDGALLLVMLRQGDSDAPVPDPVISAPATLPTARVRGEGLYAFAPVQAGRYAFRFSAPGFAPVERAVEVDGGDASVLVVRMAPAPLGLARVVVTASRYDLERTETLNPAWLDRRAIESTPDLGSDPLRAVQRLPGAASGGLSGRSHMRGGHLDEVAIHLNGHRLLDPFHIRDYQSLFSAIDVRAVEAMQVYTGGFPVRYGDRTGGLVLVDAATPVAARRTELGLSTYNVSLLSAGQSGSGALDWLFSARYSTLDEFINSRLGTPSYHDAFAQVGFAPSPGTRILVNALLADDRTEIIFENEGEEQDRSRADSRNRQLWLTVDHAFSPRVAGTTVLSHARLDSNRSAFVNEPEKIAGSLRDDREIERTGLRQDLRIDAGDHQLMAGFEVWRERARYRYTGEVAYEDLFASYQGVPEERAIAVSADPSGASYGVYLADRWQATDRLTLEGGLRFDRQTYTETAGESQWSPRLATSYALDDRSMLRLSWGRYHQAQGIEHLQVEDGESFFHPAEAVDHWIASWQRDLGSGMSARVEAYYKDLRELRPRYENRYDSLALIPELQPDRIRVDPSGGRARGLELSLQRSGEAWSAWASYTLSEVEERVGEVTQLRSWDQRHALQAGLTWLHGPWEFSAAASVRSGWPTTGLTAVFDEAGDEDDFLLVPARRNAERHRNFASLDLRLARRFQLADGELTAFFELTNAFDRENPCCLDFEVEDGELLRSEEFWLPLLPALGLRWDF